VAIYQKEAEIKPFMKKDGIIYSGECESLPVHRNGLAALV
jgi:hypothetical protein